MEFCHLELVPRAVIEIPNQIRNDKFIAKTYKTYVKKQRKSIMKKIVTATTIVVLAAMTAALISCGGGGGGLGPRISWTSADAVESYGYSPAYDITGTSGNGSAVATGGGGGSGGSSTPTPPPTPTPVSSYINAQVHMLKDDGVTEYQPSSSALYTLDLGHLLSPSKTFKVKTEAVNQSTGNTENITSLCSYTWTATSSNSSLTLNVYSNNTEFGINFIRPISSGSAYVDVTVHETSLSSGSYQSNSDREVTVRLQVSF